ncbi:hypothetical protein ACFLUH_01565 [Chloroflexota bacterium]
MPYDWGPHYIIPSESYKDYSGMVRLREELDEELLLKELEDSGISGSIVKIVNPWYIRRKYMDTWTRIGESEDRQENFPVRLDTTILENGKYEIMVLMHVFVKKGDDEIAIARENTVEVTIKN